MSIGRNTNPAVSPDEPSRRRRNTTRVVIVSLGIVIFAASITALSIIRSSHGPVPEPNHPNEASISPAASKAEPGSAAALAITGRADSQPVKRNGEARVHTAEEEPVASSGKTVVALPAITEESKTAPRSGSQSDPSASLSRSDGSSLDPEAKPSGIRGHASPGRRGAAIRTG